MLVVGMNHSKPPTSRRRRCSARSSSTARRGFANGDDISNGAPGEPCLVQGRVLSVTGEPVPARGSRSGRPTTTASMTSSTLGSTSPAGAATVLGIRTDATGSGRSSRSALPDSRRRTGRGSAARRQPLPDAPGHVHIMVSADGYETVTTHVFADGDPYLDSDAVFGVKSELVAPVVRTSRGARPTGASCKALLEHHLRHRARARGVVADIPGAERNDRGADHQRDDRRAAQVGRARVPEGVRQRRRRPRPAAASSICSPTTRRCTSRSGGSPTARTRSVSCSATSARRSSRSCTTTRTSTGS